MGNDAEEEEEEEEAASSAKEVASARRRTAGAGEATSAAARRAASASRARASRTAHRRERGWAARGSQSAATVKRKEATASAVVAATVAIAPRRVAVTEGVVVVALRGLRWGNVQGRTLEGEETGVVVVVGDVVSGVWVGRIGMGESKVGVGTGDVVVRGDGETMGGFPAEIRTGATGEDDGGAGVEEGTRWRGLGRAQAYLDRTATKSREASIAGRRGRCG